MNKRIQELAEQADKLSVQYANKHNANCIDAFNIVFAELIVKECAELVEYNSKGAGRDIREHFGVEE